MLSNSDQKDTESSDTLQSAKPTKSDILELLETELATIETTRSKSGWNMWALTAALASISWLTLQEIEVNRFNALSSIYYLICALIAADICMFTFSGSGNKIGLKQNENRFRPTHFLEHRKLFFYISFFRTSLLCIAAWYFAYSTNTSVPLFFYIYSGIMLFLWIAVLVMVYSKSINIQTNNSEQTQSNGYIFNMLFLSIPVATILEYTNLQWIPDSSVSSLKLALLVAAGIEITRLISSHSQTPPLYYTLLSIRRDLFFGNTTHEQAAKQVEIALYGLRLSEIFQNDLREMLSQANEISATLVEKRAKVVSMLKISKKIESDYIAQEMSPKDILEFKSRFSEFSKIFSESKMALNLSKTKSMLESFKSRFKTFSQKLLLTALFNQSIKPDLDFFLNQIGNSIDMMDKEEQKYSTAFDQLDASVRSIELLSKSITDN